MTSYTVNCYALPIRFWILDCHEGGQVILICRTHQRLTYLQYHGICGLGDLGKIPCLQLRIQGRPFCVLSVCIQLQYSLWYEGFDFVSFTQKFRSSSSLVLKQGLLRPDNVRQDWTVRIIPSWSYLWPPCDESLAVPPQPCSVTQEWRLINNHAIPQSLLTHEGREVSTCRRY